MSGSRSARSTSSFNCLAIVASNNACGPPSIRATSTPAWPSMAMCPAGCEFISLLPSLVQSRWSAAEELDGDGAELVVELEDAAVPGVRVDDQLGALDAPVQVLGEGRGHHPVVVAVGD